MRGLAELQSALLWISGQLLPIGLAISVLGAFAIAKVAADSVGERIEIERSLARLDRDLREWSRIVHNEPPAEPLYVTVLNAVQPLGRKVATGTSIANLVQKILLAGSPLFLTIENILALKVVAVFTGAFVFVLAAISGAGSLGMLALLFAALIYEAPDLVIGRMADSRQIALRRTLPDALDLLSVTVSAGLSFDAAMSQVIKNSTGPVAVDFSRFLQEKQIGMSTREALQSLAHRTTVPEFKAFAAAMLQAEKMGVAVAPVLRELTADMRLKRRQYAQEQAMKAPVKILFPMMFLIFPVIFIVALVPAVLNLDMGALG